MVQIRVFLLLLFLLGATVAAHADPRTLPRLEIDDFQYRGAFRLPATTFGDSSLNYAQGPIEYYPANNSLFIVGHSHHQAIAEFRVPALNSSETLSELNMAASPIQVFSQVLNRPTGGNTQDINRIGGLKIFAGPSGPELVVNAYEYYDAPGDNTHTTLVLRNANDLALSTVDGYFEFQGTAAHTSGWMSAIPTAWQGLLGGTHITGHSSGVPIISRLSVGPSAFAFTPSSIVGNASVPTPIPNIPLLDFSLANPLHEDLSNSDPSRSNKLWTHLSRAVYGFIVPDTRTYVTLGYSGGHESGVCYKCTQSDGKKCGGYCAPDVEDYYQFYWFWDVNDLLAVKQGTVNSYDVRPYAYASFPTPFQTNELGGGSFDPASGLLYLTVQRADREQGTYSNPPVVIVYSFSTADVTPPNAPRHLRFKP